jgi:predicted DNA-binding transcriptional regulator
MSAPATAPPAAVNPPASAITPPATGNPAATGNPGASGNGSSRPPRDPRDPKDPAAAPFKKLDERQIIRKNLEYHQNDTINNIGVDDYGNYPSVNVQQLVVLGHSAKASSKPDRIHNFIANILNRSRGSTKITNGNIYYIKKEDYALIENAYRDISNFNGLITAPPGKKIDSLTYKSILDAYDNIKINAEHQRTINLSDSSSSTSTTLLTPEPATVSILDDITIAEIKGILKDLEKFKNDQFVAIVITDFNNTIKGGIESEYNTQITEFTTAYKTYMDSIIAYNKSTPANESTLITNMDTEKKAMDTQHATLNTFLDFTNFRNTHIAPDITLLKELSDKYNVFIGKIGSYPSDKSGAKYKEVENEIKAFETILNQLNLKIESLKTKKQANITLTKQKPLIEVFDKESTPPPLLAPPPLAPSPLETLPALGDVALEAQSVKALTQAQVAALTIPQIQALTPVQVAALTIPQIQALTTGTTPQVEALTSKQIQALTIPQIQALTTQQIKALTTGTSPQVESLTIPQIAALTALQVAALTAPQVAALTTKPSIPQVESLTPEQIEALTAPQVAALTNVQVEALTATQLLALKIPLIVGQIPALPGTVGTLTQANVESLKPAQIQLITVTDIPKLNQVEIQALKPEQVAAFTTTQLAALLPAQVIEFKPVAIAALSPAQVAALSTVAAAALLPAQVAAQKQQIINNNIYNFFEVDTIKNKFNEIKTVLEIISLPINPIYKYWTDFKTNSMGTNYTTTTIEILFKNLFTKIFNIYFDIDITNKKLIEKDYLVTIKKIYNKKNNYIKLLTKIEKKFNDNFTKIEKNFIDQNKKIYKLIIKIFKIFMNYMKNSTHALVDAKVIEINPLPVGTNIDDIKNNFTMNEVFINQFMTDNKIIFDLTEGGFINKSIPDTNELKNHLKTDLDSLIEEFIKLINLINDLNTYFQTITNTNNIYLLAELPYDIKKIADDIQIQIKDIGSKETEIAAIFDKKLGDAKKEENKAIEEYIDIIIHNVQTVIDDPAIITTTGSSHSSSTRGRGSPGGTGGPGRGRGRGRGRGAAPKS